MNEIKPTVPVRTLCPAAKKCGGCQLQNLPYPDQLRHKQTQVIRLLGRFGHVSPILPMQEPWHYRNKSQTAFGLTRSGKMISGVWQSTSGRIAATDDCLLEDTVTASIPASIRRLLCSFKIQPYDMRTGRGCIRSVMIRRGFATGQIMVTLVTGGRPFPCKKEFTHALLRAHPEITTVVFSVNESDKNLMPGTHEQVLHGSGYIEDILCGLRFRISSRSFYQVNPVQTETLYRTAVGFAGLTPNTRVIDAYCGIGTISLIAADAGAEVIGVESNPEAVKDASVNASLNGIRRIRFVSADAGSFMQELAAAGETADVVFADPPRAGCSRRFLESLIRLAPKRIVYISCNPETQARDLRYLTSQGYRADKIQPVDMFPHTGHVETVVLLSKGEVDSKKIRVEFSLEDMDMSEFQDGATYTQIKDYVLEHSGLKVSNLYISQIKRKCGIEVGKNYNLPKSEDSRQPLCPPEKEKAIREAFKYFGMI